MIPQLKLAELLATRLCHDLTGPIGAIANGAEFLSEGGAKMQEQAIELISSSAGQAVSRLQFYRRAYGRINENGEANIEALRNLTRDFFLGGKIAIDWPDTYTDSANIPISYKMGRLLINIIIIAAATLLRGGTLAVKIESDADSKTITVETKGTAIKWDKEIEMALSDSKMTLEALSPKNVQAYMTQLLAEEIGATVQWKINENDATITISQKQTV